MIGRFEKEEWSILHSEVGEQADIAILLTMLVSVRHWSVGRRSGGENRHARGHCRFVLGDSWIMRVRLDVPLCRQALRPPRLPMPRFGANGMLSARVSDDPFMS